ncbi:hypothetical protein [Spirosoma pollinicola]|uniref:hypothetical protein n=1 Tax=Spirosoma pollinicola TaxID=2057025 RepID=UPI001980740A|nr:hypothetical protein [Spirosoma pollinicola]
MHRLSTRNVLTALACLTATLPAFSQGQATVPASTTVTSLAVATPADVAPVTVAKPAETPAPTAFSLKFSGFVRNDFSIDSRQNTLLREASVDLYPKDKQLDIDGKDINAVTNTNMLAINSRLGMAFSGPDAFGAKVSGLLEMEFFGPSDAAVGAVRLRHAWAKLDWSKRQIAFGQFWHPLFVPEVFPGVINFNTGIPFQPFNRSPQIRLTEHLSKNVHLIIAAIAQRDFTSIGINAGSSEYLRNSAVPNMHAQLQYKSDRFVAGAAFDYKLLKPRLSVGSGATLRVSNATVGSTAMMVYMKAVGKSVTFKAEAMTGSNMTDHVMLGGYLAYGVNGIETSYKPTKITSVWADLSGNGKVVVPGIFFGYCTTSGADINAIAAYGRGIALSGRGAINDLMRVSPRVEFIAGKFKIGTELEITSAAYGTSTSDAKVSDTESFTNTRLLLTTTYAF